MLILLMCSDPKLNLWRTCTSVSECLWFSSKTVVIINIDFSDLGNRQLYEPKEVRWSLHVHRHVQNVEIRIINKAINKTIK